MLEHRESSERPFFGRVRVWDEDPDVASEGVYLEVTPSGDVLAFGHRLARARMPGGADHGIPWLHLRARSRCSSLVVLDDGTILCGYGAWVCRFNLAWLEGQADRDA